MAGSPSSTVSSILRFNISLSDEKQRWINFPINPQPRHIVPNFQQSDVILYFLAIFIPPASVFYKRQFDSSPFFQSLSWRSISLNPSSHSIEANALANIFFLLYFFGFHPINICPRLIHITCFRYHINHTGQCGPDFWINILLFIRESLSFFLLFWNIKSTSSSSDTHTYTQSPFFCLYLYIVGWIPGVLHAWWIITKYQTPEHSNHNSTSRVYPSAQSTDYTPIPPKWTIARLKICTVYGIQSLWLTLTPLPLTTRNLSPLLRLCSLWFCSLLSVISFVCNRFIFHRDFQCCLNFTALTLYYLTTSCLQLLPSRVFSFMYIGLIESQRCT